MSRLLFAFYYPVVSFCRLAVYYSVYRFIFITCYLTVYLSMVCHLVPIIFCHASSSYYRLLVFLLSFCHLSVTVLLISCYRFVELFRRSQRIRHGMEVIVRGILHEVIVASLRSVRFVLRSRHLAFLFFLSFVGSRLLGYITCSGHTSARTQSRGPFYDFHANIKSKCVGVCRLLCMVPN